MSLPFDDMSDLLEHKKNFSKRGPTCFAGRKSRERGTWRGTFLLHKFGEAGIRRRGTWRSSMAEAIDEARNQAVRMRHTREFLLMPD